MAGSSRSTGKKGQSGSGKPVAPRRDFGALKQRRMQAAEMFRRGKRQVDVVVALRVSAQTASRWHKAWLEGGREALAGAGRVGRLRKLSAAQLALAEAALAQGPAAHGFPTQMWTLARVAEVIERVTRGASRHHADLGHPAGSVEVEPATPSPPGRRA